MKYNLYEELNKNISFARVQSELIMQPHLLNPQGTIHGGELMKMMDNVAGMVGRKHCKGMLVTARFDDIEFHQPVRSGNMITIIGQLIYVGTASMEIMVQIYVHDLMNFSKPDLCTSAFVTMVHMVDWKPHKAPELVVQTKEEEILYQLGQKKSKEIKEKIKNSK